MFQIPREEILFCPTTSSISSLHKLTLAKDQIGKFRLGVKNEPGQRLTELCQENTLVIANILFQQYKRQRYTGTSPDDQYQNQIDYILHGQRWRSSIQSAITRSGADCGTDHELLITNFRLKLKKVEETTRLFRYHLNQSLMIIQWK